ncbi:hypothetical protein FOL47_004650 [Perkinsus chesapeaki]|uniref:Polynucleotide adenylyltransferase n=1 Tax=Perkinsus chesapeaki TaxID=330153 RepID=A0A7J6M2N0_PERCH|nr:hypothetical protein FOL47_004650 [Perkinsus chesapeaki]
MPTRQYVRSAFETQNRYRAAPVKPWGEGRRLKRSAEDADLSVDRNESSKGLKQLSVVMTDKIEKSLTPELADEYFSSHHVDECFSNNLNKTINELTTFIVAQTSLVGIRVQITPYGSFASGTASKLDSSVDLLLTMAGGVCDTSDEDALAGALLGGLNEFPKFRNDGVSSDADKRIRCRMIDASMPDFLIKVTKASSFSVVSRHLIETRFIRSYSCCGPFLAPLVCLIRHWAKSHVPVGSGVISGYIWSLLCINFLQYKGILPNLHMYRRDGCQQLKYGPRARDSFTLVSSSDIAARNGMTNNGDGSLGVLYVEFFRWLADKLEKSESSSVMLSVSEKEASNRRVSGGGNGLIIVNPFDCSDNIIGSVEPERLSNIITTIEREARQCWFNAIKDVCGDATDPRRR